MIRINENGKEWDGERERMEEREEKKEGGTEKEMN